MSATSDSGQRPGGRMESTRDRRRGQVFWPPLRSIDRTLESAGKIRWTAAGLSSVMKSISPSMLKRYLTRNTARLLIPTVAKLGLDHDTRSSVRYCGGERFSFRFERRVCDLVQSCLQIW